MSSPLNAPATASSPPPPPAGSNAIWSTTRDDITVSQLQKFWSVLPLQARQELLRIDKQTLFEQARRNLYCSRCNGLLLEGFSQIVMCGKSAQQEGAGFHLPSRTGDASKFHSDSVDVLDPSVHPWGGLAASRDGVLTLLDCFLNAKSLMTLQNVFDNARAREHERELLYPDACGGGRRGWISQGMTTNRRGHGTREACALHTASLSCDTLVDFWSGLSEETRASLLRMKEGDFIERLVCRFESKKFCRECRRNVIREFKALKELKRIGGEIHCTSWFCVADSAFQYEVSKERVQADWDQSFSDAAGTYHHFEWAIGTGKGKSDIMEFEDVGMSGKVQVSGLDLGELHNCFITLRAWKLDGRCNELCVKAHALNGRPCLHRWLAIGDGHVTITKGESIRRFFEHAEEAEEEEDDDSKDTDGTDIDRDGSRPQKHAKSPELAREFLLDAATVIFKEQVEMAFREGTTRQNAHSIFVSLALKLLEERLRIACKELVTVEKQIKLIEEEEREKREEEERRERRRMKEREKKLRRKEKLKEKEMERELKQSESCSLPVTLQMSSDVLPKSVLGDASHTIADPRDSVSDPGEVITLCRPISPDLKDEKFPNQCDTMYQRDDGVWHQCHVDGELGLRDSDGSFIVEQSKSFRRKLRMKKGSSLGQVSMCCEGSVHNENFETRSTNSSRSMNGRPGRVRERLITNNVRSCSPKFTEKDNCLNNRLRERDDFLSSSSSQISDYSSMTGYHMSTVGSSREIKTSNTADPTADMAKPLQLGSKYIHGCNSEDNSVHRNGKPPSGNSERENIHTRKVWEPLDARKMVASDVTSRSSVVVDQSGGMEFDKSGTICSSEISTNLSKDDTLSSQDSHVPDKSTSTTGCVTVTNSGCYSKGGVILSPTNDGDPTASLLISDKSSSCHSAVGIISTSSDAQMGEPSSTSDSEGASPQSEGRDDTAYDNCRTTGHGSSVCTSAETESVGCLPHDFPLQGPTKSAQVSGYWHFGPTPPPRHKYVPVYASPAVVYQNPSSLVAFPQPNHFVFPQNHLGYSLPAASSSEFSMQYNPLQAASTPLFHPRHHSLCQPNNTAYMRSSIAQPASSFHHLERRFPGGPMPLKPASNWQGGPAGNASKLHDSTSSFSLFHFGGPVAASPKRCRESLKEKFSAAQANLACLKETTIGEYSLFSSGLGFQF